MNPRHMFTYRPFRIELPDGIQLEAREYHTKPKYVKGSVIVAHGMGGCLNPEPLQLTNTPDDAEDALAMSLARRGFRALIYNQRGHGGSDSGSLSIRRSIDDLEFISDRYMDEENRFALGYSMGGYAALHVAARRPELYRAVAAIAAPHSMRQVIPEGLHRKIEKVIKWELPEGVTRLIIVGLKVGVFNNGHRLEYIKRLLTDRSERRRLFTHIGNSKLPDRLAFLYLDLIHSPDLENLEKEIETPTYLLHPEEESFVHPKGDRKAYLDVFRRKIKTLEIEDIPGTGHACDKDGMSLLELDKYFVDRIAEHFERHLDVPETTQKKSVLGSVLSFFS